MKNKLACLSFLTSLLLWISACTKEKEPSPPMIQLLAGGIYTPNHSVLPIGAPVRFGIVATGTDIEITNLVIKKMTPGGQTTVMLDSGMNTSGFTVNEVFYQSVEDTAQWVFQLMDKNRQFATTSLTLYKDPNSSWGGIYEYPSITLGYQDNSQVGHFLNPSTGTIYTTDSAALFQEHIDIAVYYFIDENLPSPTFSSPGEQGGGILTYYPSLSTWTVKRYTKWDISVDADPVPAEAFNACHNDSLLILSYDDVWGKRKFKWSDPGDVIPFLTVGGKKGLIHVMAADHDPAGTITFALKIQQ